MDVSLSAANALERAIDRKIKNATTKRTRIGGVVSRVDVDGTVYVIVDGSTVETPASATAASVKPGDAVNVTVDGGKLSIESNYTDPSAGGVRVDAVESTASSALMTANRAAVAADMAESDAKRAHDAAEQAAQVTTRITEYEAEAQESLEDILDSAMSAAGDAADAKQSATEAKGSAASALQSAKAAQYGLSDVEKVVGTLNWIAEHGSYVNQAGQAFDAAKTYYTRSGTSPNYVYTVVAEPVASDIASYYLLSIDESVNNYIASHIAQTDYGLDVMPSNTAYRIHVGTLIQDGDAGVYILNGSKVVGFYGENSVIGDADGAHIVVGTDGSGNPRIGLWANSQVEVAYISNNELYIERTVVLSAMKIGKWQWTAMASGNLRLQWVG